MEAIAVRKKIHEFVDKADNRMLRMLEAIVDAEEEYESSVPESFYKVLDKEREQHLNEASPSYGWKEVKERLISNYGL